VGVAGVAVDQRGVIPLGERVIAGSVRRTACRAGRRRIRSDARAARREVECR
jgi:hypothetical protein